MANWLTYRIKVGDDVLVLADEEAQELIKNETERSKKADAQTASFLESTTTNGIIRNSKSDPFGQTAIGGMKVVIDKGDLIINGNIKNHARLTRTYNVTQENRTEVFLYRFDSVTNEITGLWRDCIIQGDIILSREDKTELPLRSSGYYDILICKISIPAGATEITQDMIGDFRHNEYYCGYAKNLLVDTDETLTKSDAAADAAAVGTVISNLRKETRTRDIITEKRITNLEAGLPAERWSVDDSVAYIKDVPENALPFASVDMIGGMTYKDGDVLRSAPVTEVESVGANLIPPKNDIGTISGVSFTNNADGSITVNGTATNNIYLNIADFYNLDGEYYISGCSAGGSIATYRIIVDENNNGIAYDIGGGARFTAKKGNVYSILISVLNGVTLTNAVFKPMLNRGTTAIPYTPYRHDTLPIPAEVQALDGYGWGVNDTVYNYIDYEKKQFVKMVERIVFNGGENFSDYIDSYKLVYYSLNQPYFGKNQGCILDSHGTETYFPNGTYIGFSSEEYDVSSVEEFKHLLAEQYANGTPVTVLYELATPEVTDISDILPDDNLIVVEGGGTVTMVNEYGYDVPSEITYQLKGAEA